LCYIGPSPRLPNYDRQGTASGTCFGSGRFLSLTAFGGVCRTETTQRQKLTKTEKLRSDAYCILASSRRGILACGCPSWYLFHCAVSNSLAPDPGSGFDGESTRRRGAAGAATWGRRYPPDFPARDSATHHYCISLPPILSPESALATGPKADARLGEGERAPS
jgi:hypothetical protein